MIGYCGILLALAAAPRQRRRPAYRHCLPRPRRPASLAAAYREQARSAIREVLARREFADLHADPYAFWRMFLDWLEGLFRTSRQHPERHAGMALLDHFRWMILTLVAILAHLIYTLVMLLRGTSSPLRSNPKGGRIAGELLGIKDLDFDTVYAEARRLLAAGDWPAATRYFYVAAILWLDRQGWIVFKRWKTNRDYIDELAPRARIQGSFRQLTADFEPIVYGGLFAQEFHDTRHRHHGRRSAA